MYTLKLVYDPEPVSQTLKESITFCASIELYTQLGIDAYQNSASTLVFERDAHRTIAGLYLSNSSRYTVKMM